MKESMWGIFIIGAGILGIVIVFFFQRVTNTDQNNLTILREAAEAAMYDALDIAAYRTDGIIKIDREKFAENFVRRFADTAASSTYRIEIFDINEEPPKVSIRVSSTVTGTLGNGQETFEIVQKLDAILESPYEPLN